MSLLGLAQKARRIIWGQEPVLAALRSGRARLVFLGRDAGPWTAKDIRVLCQRKGITIIDILSKRELGDAVGKSPRAVLVVTDEGFARGMTRLFPIGTTGNREQE